MYLLIIEYNKFNQINLTPQMASEALNFYGEKEAYGEFSNFYPAPFTLNGIRYPTSEHYFQAQKFLGPNSSPRDHEYARLIISQNTPNKTKVLAGQKIGGGYKWRTDLNEIIRAYPDVQIRPDWEQVKDNIMRTAVFQKFLQNLTLLTKLLSTDNKILVEHTNRDNYWGDGGNGTGRNQLGRTLMETRSLLQYQAIPFGKDYWLIPSILLIGLIDVATLNSAGVNFLLDLSGQHTVSRAILGQDLPQPVYLYNNQYIFADNQGDLNSLADLLIEGFGKKLITYVYGTISQYQEFLPIVFSKLYQIPIETAQQLIQRLFKA
jgi:ribA/ribD-fused uncharacterized protein